MFGTRFFDGATVEAATSSVDDLPPSAAASHPDASSRMVATAAATVAAAGSQPELHIDPVEPLEPTGTVANSISAVGAGPSGAIEVRSAIEVRGAIEVKKKEEKMQN
jgi:hypothetical protein